jgi:hypothetical protein
MKAISLLGLAGLGGLALVASVACGSPSSAQEGSASDSDRGSFSTVSAEVRTEADLPSCRPDNAGAWAIVDSNDALQECTGSQWTAIASAAGAGAYSGRT